MKRLAIVACMALMLMGGGFAYANPTSYLSMDINGSSVRFEIDTFDRVVDVEASIDLSGIDVEGMKVKEAVSAIVKAAVAQGILGKDNASEILLTAATKGDDKDKTEELNMGAAEVIDRAVAKNEIDAEVSQAAISEARYIAADGAGISPGKLNLIQKLWEAEGNEIETDQELAVDFGNILKFSPKGSAKPYAELSVKEIMDAIKVARGKESNTSIVSGTEEENKLGKGHDIAPGQNKEAVDSQETGKSEIVKQDKGHDIAPGQTKKNPEKNTKDEGQE